MPLAFNLSVALVLLCCRPTNKAESMGDTTTGVGHVVVNAPNAPGSQKMGNGIQTAIFIEQVALGNLFESTLGKLAFEKAENKEVRAFGKLMEQDHKRIRDSLKNLASARGFRLPVLLPAKELEQVRQMSKMEPVYFEELYMKMMLEEHDKYIELFKGAINSPDTPVSSFAHRFLPVLETNRETALKVVGSLRGDG